MKKTKLLCLTLALATTLSACASLFVGAEATAVSGTNALDGKTSGTVIYDENYFKTNIDSAFSVNTVNVTVEEVEQTVDAGTVTWNETTGRIAIASSSGKSMVTTISAIPVDYINYTLQAELYLTAGSGKKFGMGINSNNTWAKSTWVQLCEGSKSIYLNNQGGKNNGAAQGSFEESYAMNDKVILRVEVSDTYANFSVYHNDLKYTFTTNSWYNPENGIALSDIAFDFGTGAPFFAQHGSATIEVDNLTVWAGTDVAEPELNPENRPQDEVLSTVYYPDGTVIFSENDIKASGADLTKMFKTNNSDTTKYSIAWNAESDRLKISSTAALVTDIIAVPKNLGYYTISADLYLTENNTGSANNAIFGMGINGASEWAKSTYFQYNVLNATDTANAETRYYVNNNSSTGNAGGNMGKAELPAYDVNTTKISVRFEVNDTTVIAYLNGEFLTMIKLDKLGYELGEGSPWFFQRQNTTIEIDNLVVYAGITAPDYEKTMANQTPLTAPDIQQTGDGEGTGDGSGNGGFFDDAGDEEEEDDGENTTADTAADTTADTKADTTAETEAEASGCGSAVGAGIIGVVALTGMAAVFGKRKRK